MGLILAIYTNNAYQEVHLPSTDNADYDVWLRAKEYRFTSFYGCTGSAVAF